MTPRDYLTKLRAATLELPPGELRMEIFDCGFACCLAGLANRIFKLGIYHKKRDRSSCVAVGEKMGLSYTDTLRLFLNTRHNYTESLYPSVHYLDEITPEMAVAAIDKLLEELP